MTVSNPPIPGLPAIPLLGRVLGLLRLFRDPLRTLPRLYREYGEVAALNRGDPSLVCAFGPTYNQQIIPHARDFEHVGEMPLRIPKNSALARMQINLTTHNGEGHRRQRRLMMPAFSRQAIANHRDDIVAVAQRRLEGWEVGSTVELVEEMLGLTLEVMMKCLFGLDAGRDADDIGAMSTRFLEQIISPTTAIVPLDLPLLPYRRLLRLTERLEGRLLKIVADRRAAPGEGRDVLSLLIAANDREDAGLTDEELLGNMGLLFVAGHETTAYALAWTLFLLAQYPQVRGDLLDELSVLGGAPPQADDLERLPLLSAVVDESLRMLPPTYIAFMRRGLQPFALGPYELPAGSQVVLSPLVTHHMPEVFPEPRRFRPERWAGTRPSSFEFLPFGIGPRHCLGAGFANLEIRVVLAIIVQRFAWSLADGAQVDPKARGITMAPGGGLHATLHAPTSAQRGPADVGGGIREFVTW